MDILEQFDIYLTKWCKSNHKPKPDIDNINKYWQMAWEDFMKTDLTAEWEERKNNYLDIHLLTKKEQRKLEQNDLIESVEQEEETSNENIWERIQKFLK